MPTCSRRGFLAAGTALVAARAAWGASTSAMGAWARLCPELAREERARVLRAARACLNRPPETITSVPAPRSAGGLHDYFSEGDYWWPDPKNPNGPYIQRDGQSNPANFNAHRELMVRLSLDMPALAAAWLLTGQSVYAEHAAAHLRAWFMDPATRMNPNLEYAQAIHGRDTGRSIGIIDTVHLAEVAQAALVLQRGGALAAATAQGARAWFADYLAWLTTSDRGRQERDTKNNHASCWLLQTVAFATLTGDDAVLAFCRQRIQNTIFPGQLASNGSFPQELRRTKPYSYSLFDLDILGMCAQSLSLSGSGPNLWTWTLPDGRGLQPAFAFMVPYIANKRGWPYRADVEYFDDLPVRQPSLLFAGLAYQRPDYIALWQRLDPDPTITEVIRNHPIRQPLLWTGCIPGRGAR